jgi:hypothetical protein
LNIERRSGIQEYRNAECRSSKTPAFCVLFRHSKFNFQYKRENGNREGSPNFGVTQQNDFPIEKPPHVTIVHYAKNAGNQFTIHH